MVTGFDIWGHDAGLRRHWKGRFLAFIVDALMILVPLPLILYMFEITDMFTVGLTVSVGFFLFSAVMESITGSSVGKKLLGYSVRPVGAQGLGGRACVRNLGRLLWFFLPPLDFALGMSLRGDPRQTLLDRLAGTVIVHRGETETFEAHIEALRKAEPEPEAGTSPGDVCRECGGNLVMLQDSKLQCEDCGLIQ